jgi:hypothetical protein
MPKINIKNSVGHGGRNDPIDVLLVKKRFAELGFNWLSHDEKADASLTKVIKLFQSIIGGKSGVSGDGLINAGKNTHLWLEENNAPKWIQIQSQKGTGWENTNENTAREIKYGGYATDWLKTEMESIGKYYNETYQKQNSKLKSINLNDCSPVQGHDTPDHKGHETGLDVDIKIPKKNGSFSGITYNSSEYDQDATRKILESIKKRGNVRATYFNDPVLIKEGLCTSMGGHDNHIHVSFKAQSRGQTNTESEIKKENGRPYLEILKKLFPSEF